MKLIVLPLFIVVAAALCLCVTADQPDFCMGWECPEYDIIRSSDAFEIRRYPQTRWMSVRFRFSKTDPIKEAFLHALTEGNKILTDYRGGDNEDKIELNLTYPLRVTLTESDDAMSLVTSYFLPSIAQQRPPRPNDLRIFQEDLPEVNVAVSVYKQGVPSWRTAESKWQSLRAALRAEGILFCDSTMDVLSYDYRANHSEVAVVITQPAPSLTSPPAVDSEGEPISTGNSNNDGDAVAEPNDHPDFCGDRDCPDFEVKRSTRTFEIREYSAANWAVVNVTIEQEELDAAYDKALKVAFPIIYTYRQKGNEEQVELAHTLPMTVVWQKCEKNQNHHTGKCFVFFFAYFIPYQFQDKVPTPNDKRLEISSWGPLSLAVRSFGGFVTSLSQVHMELDKLKQDLESHGEKYDDVVDALAQYDPIWKMADRHNEVHVLIKDERGARLPFLRPSSSPSDAVAEPNDHPDFCGKRDCPDFEVKRSTRTFEIREYPKAHWAVVTHEESGSLDQAYLKALKTVIPLIVGYRNKGNKEEVELVHTLPMLVAVHEDKEHQDDKDKAHKFCFAYFIPFDYQDKVPTPHDKRVKIMSVGPVSLAVRSFSGFVSSLSKVAKRELAKLEEDLKSHEEDYHKNKFLVAQYDPIFKIAQRHNEVAVLLKSKERPEDTLTSLPFFSAFAVGVAEQQPEEESENTQEEAVGESVAKEIQGQQEDQDEEGAEQADGHMPPAFCHEHDCPDFDKIRSGRHFSVRSYKKAMWLSFNQTSHSAFVQDADFKAVMQSAMNIIMEYNSGHNKEGVKVPMTVPVRVMLRERYGPQKDKTLYKVSFFVPIKFQRHTPQPLDARLELGELDEYTVATRGFNQCSLEWYSALMPQVDELAVDLSKAGEQYKRDHTIIAFYDYPQLPVCPTRHPYSEIWFPVNKDV